MPKFAELLKRSKKAVYVRRIAEETTFCFAWRFSRVLIWGSSNVHTSCLR